MKLPALSARSLGRRWQGPLYTAAKVLLGAWALGLAFAAFQLDTWRQELSRTLVQLNADAYFRARVQHRDAVDPEWYRRKALSLLAATERLQRDTSWTLFVPGSWQVFDDLEEQVQERVAREFGEIVVETIRRELFARTAQLTGVPVTRGAGDLQAGAECQSPVPANPERKLTAAAEDLPEFVAVSDYVAAVEKLDHAVQAFFALQIAGGQPGHLRTLVAYTLATELPGSLAQSVQLFHRDEEVRLQPALMQSRLQWATRCALGKAMSALHTRLLNTNDLFVLEQALAQRSAGLFNPAMRSAPFAQTAERMRAVHQLLEDQHAMLARGRNDWMRHASLQLGPAYQQLLKRIGATGLLGPEMLQQLQNQSGAAFAEFRRQFESAFSSQGQPGVIWIEQEKRFGLSPERAALREGLGVLLKASFMADDKPTPPASRPAASFAAVSQEARALVEARTQFLAQGLALFPAPAQPAVARLVDARVSELIYQKAARTLKATLPEGTGTALDPVAFRQQRDHIKGLQVFLKQTGGNAYGDRLVAILDGELARRLLVLEQDWRQQGLYDARGSDFGWWQGDAMAAAQAIGAPDTAAVPAAIARSASRLDLLGQQARSLLELGSPGLVKDPAGQKWQRLQVELERYQGRQSDSSLLRLERYFAALGPDLRRENCAERLAAHLPSAAADDDIGQRHLQIHNALASRCNELRAQAAAPAAVPATQ